MTNRNRIPAGYWWSHTAAVIAGKPAMRLAQPRGTGVAYPAGSQGPLTSELPSRPAAVMLYDETVQLHTLVLDFDAKKGYGRQLVAEEALDALQVLQGCGFAAWADYAPTGGWHVYARLHSPIPHASIVPLAKALRRRWASLDISPLVNRSSGCIRPTGSRHASGGYQSMYEHDKDSFAQLLERGTHAGAWATLLELFPAPAAEDPTIELTDATVIDLRGRSLPPRWEQIATNGGHDYDSDSEARIAIAGAAARAGWSHQDYLRAVNTRWSWLRLAFEKKHSAEQVGRWAVYEFKKAQGNAESWKTVHQMDTSHVTTRGAARDTDLDSSVNTQIRRWLTWATAEGRRATGGVYTPAQQAVVRAVGAMALTLNTTWINVGVRSLALATGLSHSGVAQILHQLEDDQLIWRTRRAQGIEADRWALNLEHTRHVEPWRGKVHGSLAVFRILGGHQVAEVYEELIRLREHEVTVTALANTLKRSRTTVTKALAALEGHQLARRSPTGWTQGTADPAVVATQLGADELEIIQRRSYATQRAKWREYLSTLPSVRATEAALLAHRERELSDALDVGILVEDELEALTRARAPGTMSRLSNTS